MYTPACVAGAYSTVYLIYFLIGNLSYSPCSEPSRIVLLLDVMFTTDPDQRSKSFYIDFNPDPKFHLDVSGSKAGYRSLIKIFNIVLVQGSIFFNQLFKIVVIINFQKQG